MKELMKLILIANKHSFYAVPHSCNCIAVLIPVTDKIGVWEIASNSKQLYKILGY